MLDGQLCDWMPMNAEESVSAWGECGEFSFDARIWRLMLSLASVFGWKPIGTLPPEDNVTGEWDGRYIPAECQEMTRADALALAAALERALDDLPDAIVNRKVKIGPPPSALEELGAKKQILRWFIAHCCECSPFLLC